MDQQGARKIKDPEYQVPRQPRCYFIGEDKWMHGQPALLKGNQQSPSFTAFFAKKLIDRQTPFVPERLSLVADKWFICR
jgi:hypothetical protein